MHMKKSAAEKLRLALRLSWRDTFLTLGVLLLTTLVCFALDYVDEGKSYVSMLYILAVFIIAVSTDGYVFGTAASVASVLIINYFFTYPVHNFNFTLSGYPLTIACTLIVSVTASTLTTKLQRHNELRLAAEKEKTRSNLLRAVSHDLRTPLTTILGASDTLIENDAELTGEQRRAHLLEIREDAQWLIRMVENLLTVTRMEDGNGATIVKTPELCEEIIPEAVQKFRKRFPDYEVRVTMPPDILFVPMDAMLIEQVLLNLLENAAIHGGEGSFAELTLEKKGDAAVFSVTDSGNGIDPEVLPHIFDIYSDKKTGSTGDAKKNMGIGLPVCRTIVRAHGGTMTAENTGSGARLRFSLPLE